MFSFREFLNEVKEEEKDIQTVLNRIPNSHKKLLSKYTFKFQNGNTLKGDDKHIGYIDDVEKKVVVAAPWRYSREMTVLHEIGHQVYEKLSNEQKEEWAKILKNTKMKNKQSPEEMFCMAYGATYSQYPPAVYNHPKWIKFVKKIL